MTLRLKKAFQALFCGFDKEIEWIEGILKEGLSQ
jgi:hypothetical protein